jgi:transposase
MRKARKSYSAPEKIAILKRHLLDKVPISELCGQHDLQPAVFYAWQKMFFENGSAAFQTPRRLLVDPRDQKIAALEAKLQRKDHVLAELMEEHVKLKKELGEL